MRDDVSARVGAWDWEKDVRAAYRHFKRRFERTPSPTTLRVSHELAMEIQNTPRITSQIDISKGGVTWQGISLRVDESLPPGCFIFDEGGIDD